MVDICFLLGSLFEPVGKLIKFSLIKQKLYICLPCNSSSHVNRTILTGAFSYCEPISKMECLRVSSFLVNLFILSSERIFVKSFIKHPSSLTLWDFSNSLRSPASPGYNEATESFGYVLPRIYSSNLLNLKGRRSDSEIVVFSLSLLARSSRLSE